MFHELVFYQNMVQTMHIMWATVKLLSSAQVCYPNVLSLKQKSNICN